MIFKLDKFGRMTERTSSSQLVKNITKANFSILNQNILYCQIYGISSHDSKFIMVQIGVNLYSAYYQKLGTIM